MLQKILDFFRNLFSGLSGGSSKPKPVDKPVKPKPEETLPPAEPTFPQDAPDIDQDTATTVVVHDVDEPVILETGDDPAGDVVVSPPVDTDTEEPEPEPDPVVEKPKHKPRYMWCLDNGHGKKTAGKRSPKFEDGRQFFEYEFNRDIVKRIIDQLEIIGVKYFNVVPEVDIDNFLEGRVGRANRLKSDLPKIFLSIHANAFGRSGWEPPSGIETWYFHTSRTGRALARIFQKHLIDKLDWKNRQLKSLPGKKQFYVLRNTSMPAVLTENGFYTNKEECRLLMKDSIRQKIADAHVEAILEIEKNGL
jgi:N-acetylmuramoyl-L-alanine amidase